MGYKIQEKLCFEQKEEVTVLLGGCDHSETVKDVDVYAPSGATINIPESPLDTCTKPSSVYFNGSIVLCGGEDKNKSTACYSHELGTTEWSVMPSLNEHRERFTMNAVGDLIAVVGGFKSGTDIEVFKEGKWMRGPYLKASHGVVHHCAVSYGESQIMVIGGMVDGNTTNIVQSLDLYTNEVSMLSSLNKHRYSHACSKATWDGEEFIVVAGGFETFSVCNSVEYIPVCNGKHEKGNVWTTLSPMNVRRYDFGLSMYGTLLAAFGGEPTISSEEIEVYNFTSKTWTLTGKKIAHPERHYFTAISVPVKDLPVETGETTEGISATPEAPPTTFSPETTVGISIKPSSVDSTGYIVNPRLVVNSVKPAPAPFSPETTIGMSIRPPPEDSSEIISNEKDTSEIFSTEEDTSEIFPTEEDDSKLFSSESTEGVSVTPSPEDISIPFTSEVTTVTIPETTIDADYKYLMDDIEKKKKDIEDLLNKVDDNDNGYVKY